MNEQAQEALNRMITMAVDGMEGAVSFAQAELPDVIEQLLVWKLLESLITAVLPVIAALTFTLAFFTVTSKVKRAQVCEDNDGRAPYQVNYWWSRYEPSGVGYVATFGTGIGAMLSIFASLITMNLTWLQILVAPKLYLLEYAANLVK